MRASQVKKELEQTKALESKLEAKDNDIKELRLLLKLKQEEIGELNIRKDIAEKKIATNDDKLTNVIRDYELSLQKLQVCVFKFHNLPENPQNSLEIFYSSCNVPITHSK